MSNNPLKNITDQSRRKSLRWAVVGVLFGTGFSWVQCSTPPPASQEIQTDSDYFGSVDMSEAMDLDSGEIKVFTLPTPLQVSTILEEEQIAYNPKALSDAPSQLGGDQFYTGLQLGMQILDLGYVVAHNQQQAITEHIVTVKKLADALDMKSAKTADLFTRLEANHAQQDSLSRIILETYNHGYQFFSDNGREGVGLLILTGGFLEGFSLVANHDFGEKSDVKEMLMVQQKYFLDNIVELLGYYKGTEETDGLYNRLYDIKRQLDLLEINHHSENPFKLQKPFAELQMSELTDEINEIRKAIVSEDGTLQKKVINL